MPDQSNRVRRWWILIPAMTLPLVMSLFYFVAFPGTALGNGLYALMKVMLVVWPFAATTLILREPFSLCLWPRKSDRTRALWLGIASGGTIVALMLLLMQTPLGAMVEAGAPRIRERVAGMGVLNHFLLFALFLSIIHSLIEEVYWRWFVYGNLRRLITPSWAHVLAAGAFAAHHLVVLSQFFSFGLAVFLAFCVAVGGWLWSQLWERQGTLLGAWLSHLLVDLGIMALGAHLMGIL